MRFIIMQKSLLDEIFNFCTIAFAETVILGSPADVGSARCNRVGHFRFGLSEKTCASLDSCVRLITIEPRNLSDFSQNNSIPLD